MRTILVTLLFLTVTTFCYSQSPIRKLLTRSIEQQMLQIDSIRSQKNATEQFISRHKPFGKINTKTIPLIFHVLYSSPEEQISIAQIQSQIDALNLHFNKQTNNFANIVNTRTDFDKSQPDNVRIQFCFAAVANNINYVPTLVNKWGADDAIKESSSGTPPLMPDKFLNVWVGHLADSVSGYSTMPWAIKERDGIVIDYRFFGTEGTATAPYDEGKTLTHLVGNYLGLYDLWSDNCEDDNVADTPIHNAPNVDCSTYQHVTTCYEHPVEMSMNFMDNTYDACMNMFTQGQMLRMHSLLGEGGLRHSIVADKNLTVCSAIKYASLTAEDRNQTTQKEVTKPTLTDFILRPNPANGQVELVFETDHSETKEIQILVFNATGKKLLEQRFSLQPLIPLATDKWMSGLYFVYCQLDGQVLTKQLVISR